MEEYTVQLNGKTILTMILEGFDESMGVKMGTFIPLEGYHEIEQLIKDYSKLAAKFNAIEFKRNRRCREFQKKLDELNFGIKVFCNEDEIDVSHIHLMDYSDTLGDEGHYIQVFLEK